MSSAPKRNEICAILAVTICQYDFDVREIVEHQAADGDLLDVEHPCGLRQMLQRRVVGMESQRDEGLEAAGFILQAAQLEQVIDAVFVVFDVAIEHGRVGFQTDLVGELRGLEPLVAVDFVIADDVADAVGENLGAAAGQ